jgi:hypothetical protein
MMSIHCAWLFKFTDMASGRGGVVRKKADLPGIFSIEYQ